MNRRSFLTTGSLGACGLVVDACAARSSRAPAPVRPSFHLPPVRVSWDRIIRTTVALRPHRDAGFVLRAAKLDDKMLVHNYGHGGAGMSIGWGTGAMAADLALAQPARRAAVIGCGAVGLTAGRQLQRRGFDVTIYAANVPPDVTSNWSLAGFTPTSGLVDPERRTPEWDAQFRQAANIAYRQLQLLVGAGYGVSWVDNYSPRMTPPTTPRPEPGGRTDLEEGLQSTPELLGPGEHPFPTPYVTRSAGLRIEPSIYLEALVHEFGANGGRVVIRKFETPRDLMTLTEGVIVNCTGLGARDLFNDQELIPLKGQLTLLVPQPEITYRTSGGLKPAPPPPALDIHTMPRRDGIALGGTSQRGLWTLEPDDAERRRIVEEHIALFSKMNAG